MLSFSLCCLFGNQPFVMSQRIQQRLISTAKVRGGWRLELTRVNFGDYLTNCVLSFN